MCPGKDGQGGITGVAMAAGLRKRSTRQTAQEVRPAMAEADGCNQGAPAERNVQPGAIFHHAANAWRSRIKAGISRKAGGICAAVRKYPHENCTEKNYSNPTNPSKNRSQGYFLPQKSGKGQDFVGVLEHSGQASRCRSVNAGRRSGHQYKRWPRAPPEDRQPQAPRLPSSPSHVDGGIRPNRTIRNELRGWNPSAFDRYQYSTSCESSEQMSVSMILLLYS